MMRSNASQLARINDVIRHNLMTKYCTSGRAEFKPTAEPAQEEVAKGQEESLKQESPPPSSLADLLDDVAIADDEDFGSLFTESHEILLQDDLLTDRAGSYATEKERKRFNSRFHHLPLPGTSLSTYKKRGIDEYLCAIVAIQLLNKSLIPYDANIPWMAREMSYRKLLPWADELLIDTGSVSFAINPIVAIAANRKPHSSLGELAPISTMMSRIHAYQTSKETACRTILASPISFYVASLVAGLYRTLTNQTWDVADGTTAEARNKRRKLRFTTDSMSCQKQVSSLSKVEGGADDAPVDQVVGVQERYFDERVLGKTNHFDAVPESDELITRCDIKEIEELEATSRILRDMPPVVALIFTQLIVLVSVKIAVELEADNVAAHQVPVLHREDLVPGLAVFHAKQFAQLIGKAEEVDEATPTESLSNILTNDMGQYWTPENRQRSKDLRWSTKNRGSRLNAGMSAIMSALYIVLSPVIPNKNIFMKLLSRLMPGSYESIIKANMRYLWRHYGNLYNTKSQKSKCAQRATQWVNHFLKTNIIEDGNVIASIPFLQAAKREVVPDATDHLVFIYTYFRDIKDVEVNGLALLRGESVQASPPKKRKRSKQED
eukprot:GHVH01007903.1.p1 GENE.GHVH01007903.1~~GHVH01007903.1.p1  ORF type:complete len:608 (+),score=105.62 GHVH01007903.1:499-2322(+)